MRFWWACAALAACAPVPASNIDAGLHRVTRSTDGGAPPDAGVECLALEAFDAEAADAGSVALTSGTFGGDFVPRLAWDNLWFVWGGAQPADVPAATRARYGPTASPVANDNLPWGFRQSGGNVRADCLVCHSGEVAGVPMLGAANNQLDLELLVDDLKALAVAANQPPPPTPDIRTGARGVTDIMGLTMQLAKQQAPGAQVNTELGYQDPPAWWAISAKTRLYTDGSAPSSMHRTFLATQLAFGATQQQLEALEPEAENVRQYFLSMQPPSWPFAAPDVAAVERGRAMYRERCVSCHRDDRCERAESVETTVGTDAERAEKYGVNEAALVNASWFGGDVPVTASGKYVAPPLRGLWASAPYFHNGSVPTVAGVLDSASRPAFFRIRGTSAAEYDEVNVGLKVDVLTAAPTNPPAADRARVYDTTKAGLHNTGHTFGDSLSGDERADLIAFLKTL